MNDLLLDIINYIIAHGLAVAKDVDIFKDYSPVNPVDCTIIYEYNGTEPASFTRTSVRSIQVTARAKSGAIASKKCWDIFNLMYQEDGLITIGTRKCIIGMRNTPTKIAVDEQNRVLFAFNCAITTNF